MYPRSVRAGLSERDFYRFIHALVCAVFIVTSIYYVRDAYALHQLLFQSCSPYAEFIYGSENVYCPCGVYPAETQGACSIPPSSSE